MQTTVQYKVSAPRTGYRRLDKALLDMGHPYNALVLHHKAAYGSHEYRWSRSAQTKAITQLRKQDPDYASYACKLLYRTAKWANLAWDASLKATYTLSK